ncbi:MAG: PIN domain-containing protein [Egibacteraceae bacterium]
MLDTTFLVDAERSEIDLDALIADDDDVAMAAVTVAELLVGVPLADGKRHRRRQVFVDSVLEAVPVLPYDVRVAHAHAQLLTAVLRYGRPRGAHDLIIAATAVSSHRAVLTADATGFHDLPGVQVTQH